MRDSWTIFIDNLDEFIIKQEFLQGRCQILQKMMDLVDCKKFRYSKIE